MACERTGELNAIVRTAEQLRRDEISPEEARERLRRQGIGSERLKGLIRQLQALAGES